MRLPDPARSQVILIGTAEHGAESDLPNLPAVANNLDDLQTALADPTYGWLIPQACAKILNPASPDQLGITIAEQAARADDLILIYYAGHGLLSPRGELYLATSRTNREQLRFTAFPYDGIREILNDSPAANRVVILDCCYSGRAIAAMTDPQSTAYDQLDITGTYILTSTTATTTATTTAHAPDGAQHTAFTGELITLLRVGDPDIPELVTLDHVYRATYRSLIRQGLPRPQQRGSNATPHLALIRNPAHHHPPPETEPLIPPDGVTSTPALATEPPITEPEPASGSARTPPMEPVTNRRRRGGGVAVVAAAQLLVAVFGALVAWSPSYMQQVLHMPAATSYWLNLIYFLSFVTSVLLAGRLGDVLGHRRLFRSALVVFTAAALLTGAIDTGPLQLTVFAVAGVASASVAANGLALLLATLPGTLRRGRALAVFIAVTAGGAPIGMLISASLPEPSAWRVMCEVVAAIGIVATVAARVLDEPTRRPAAFQLARGIVPTVGVGLLGFGLLYSDRAAFYGGQDDMSSPGAWGPLIAAAVILIPLAIAKARPRPTVVGYVMVFLTATLATLAPTAVGEFRLSAFGVVPKYLPVGTGLAVGALLALLLVGRFGIRAISIPGGTASAAVLLLSGAAVERGYLVIALTALTVGAIGMGAMAYCGATAAALTEVDETDHGLAVGVFNLVWWMGGICANAAWALQYRTVENGTLVNYLLLLSPALALVAGLLPLFSRQYRTRGTPDVRTDTPTRDKLR